MRETFGKSVQVQVLALWKVTLLKES